MMIQGDSVETCYGEGIVRLYRETDSMYQIELPFATLYCGKESLSSSSREDPPSAATMDDDRTAMELNVAYEALESMRKLNTELTCQERGIPLFHLEECHLCLLERTPPEADAAAATAQQQQQEEQKQGEQATMSNNKTTRYLNRLVKQQTRKATLILQTPKKSPPCLICGNPVCRKHASQAFRKEGINLCGQCETLFGLDFVVDIMSSPSAKTRQQNTDRLMDVYDRALLLLKYSAQYIDEVAHALEESTRTSNRVGLGSSSAGIVSGVLGIVSAATLFTPAGPPLLIASLLFGGSATAVQTGTEVRLHLSQPNRLADKILALHGICHSILKVVGALRDAVLRDHLRTDLYKDDAPQKVMDYNSHHAASHKLEHAQQQQTNLVTGASTLATLGLGRASTIAAEAAGAEATATTLTAAGRGARWFGRGGSAAMNTVRFARFAGGSLAAATLLLEARSLHTTLQAVRAGNPCDKAEALRGIWKEVTGKTTTSGGGGTTTPATTEDGSSDSGGGGCCFPSTAALDAECGRYLETLAHRQRALTESEVQRLLLENAEILEQARQEQLLAQQQQQEEAFDPSEAESDFCGLAGDRSERSTASSLMDRIKQYKVQEVEQGQQQQRSSNYSSSDDSSSSELSGLSEDGSSSEEEMLNSSWSLSLRERIERHKKRESMSSSGEEAELGGFALQTTT